MDCRKGGVRLEVPFFEPIAENEEIIKSNATWGESGAGYLTPKKITADSQIATILHRGGSFAVDDLSRFGSGADPYAAIGGYLARTVLKLRTRTVLAMLTGVFGTALSANAVDVSQAGAGAAEANFLSAATVIKGQNVLGERATDLSVIAMHSHVYNYLRQVGALTFSTSALSTGGAVTWGGGGVGLTSTEVASFMGLNCVVDDLLAPTINAGGADQYPVYIMGPGTIMEGVQADFRIEGDRNMLSQQDVMAWSHHYLMHIMGTSWISASDNPKNIKGGADAAADCLDQAANYALAYSTSKLIPAVKLTVNSPFAANV